MKIDNRKRIYRFLDSLSQILNVIFLNGDPNESISGRVWREQRWMAVKWINRLFFWQVEHCRGAYQTDLERSAQYLKRARR